MPRDTLGWVEKHSLILLLGILALALVLRYIALLDLKASIYYDYMLWDERLYHTWAAKIASGAFKSGASYEFPPLPAYLFALIYKLFGPHASHLRILNLALGGMQVDLVSFYIVFGKFSYFYSGVFFLISIAGFIWRSASKKRPFIEGRRSLSDLRELSWREFREYVMGLFQKMDYSSEGNGVMDDQHADLRVKRDARTSVVCCKKYYVRKIPHSMVLEFYETMLKSPSLEKGFFITTGSFSQEARKFASDKPLVLIDSERLMDLVRIAESIDAARERSTLQNGLCRTDFACPTCGAQMVLRTCENPPASLFTN